MLMEIIKVDKINKYYGQGVGSFKVLNDISLTINEGEIISIVGPSGAGKSTLLNVIGCLDGFDEGNLTIMDKATNRLNIDQLANFRNTSLGFIYQMHNLLPEFTALENVMMPLLIRRVSRKEAEKQSINLLDRFGLTDRMEHKPAELSGGECQRISAARAIVGNPRIILADEPTGSLDRENSLNLIKFLFELGREYNTTIIMVTHDKEIANLTERKITLVDGKILSDEKAVSV